MHRRGFLGAVGAVLAGLATAPLAVLGKTAVKALPQEPLVNPCLEVSYQIQLMCRGGLSLSEVATTTNAERAWWLEWLKRAQEQRHE